jgi:hypothetical protein
VENLELWEPWVRASVVDFELHSRVGFTFSAGTTASVWHLKITSAVGVAPPTVEYKALVTMLRPTEDTFASQLEHVNDYADLRGDRGAEILAQLGGSSAFLASIAFLRPERTRWTLELLAAVLRFANHVEMRFKHALACRRPIEFSPQVQPMILTPGHGSLPSGHATEAFITAQVLRKLLHAAGQEENPDTVYVDDSYGEHLMRLAARVAINRTVAGVHFPVDSAAGAVLGLTLGNYLVTLFSGAGAYVPWTFDGTKFVGPQPDGDFYWTQFYDVAATGHGQKEVVNGAGDKYVSKAAQVTVAPTKQSKVLRRLWDKAKAEWKKPAPPAP